MAQYRKRPIVIEATQWFHNGDHPQDNSVPYSSENLTLSEGEVVRRARSLSLDDSCFLCGGLMHVHGWIETLGGGHIVCPGDWIITGIKGAMYPCKPDVFEATYEIVGEAQCC